MRLLAIVVLAACQKPLHVEMGPKAHRIPTRFELAHPVGDALAQPVPEHERAAFLGVASRVGWLVENHLIVGGEGEFGFGRSTSDAPTTTEQSVALGLGGAVGLRASRWWRLSPSVELAAGVRTVERHAFFERSPYVEPRVRVDVWLNDGLSVGLYGGVGLDGAWVVGIRDVYHHEPWDGD